MFLPKNATIEEACEWMEAKTGDKWTLPRLLEEAHLTPHVWIDHIPGYPQIFGERLEGYLTKMIFNGDVARLAADRAEALITMFPAHDGRLIKVSPGWKVALKDVRFNGQALERAAEILNKQKTEQRPAPVVGSTSEAPETKEQRQDRRLQACIDAGLPMNTKAALSRLPDGVGDVGGHEGVTRQAFSADVKAALKRRQNAIREGATLHRA